MKKLFPLLLLPLLILALPVHAEDKKDEPKKEEAAAAPEKADDAKVEETKTDETKTAEEAKKDPNDKSYRFAPDFCDFEMTFPEEPASTNRCVPGGGCYDLKSYTMVYDLQTTVDVSVSCTPSTPENYKRYTEGVMKAALTGMIDERHLTGHNIQFTQLDNVRTSALNGIGTTGAQDKIFTAQMWIGQNSVFTVQAELIGSAHPKADESFKDILKSIKIKGGKQLPKAPAPANVPKPNQ